MIHKISQKLQENFQYVKRCSNSLKTNAESKRLLCLNLKKMYWKNQYDRTYIIYTLIFETHYYVNIHWIILATDELLQTFSEE